MPKAGEHDTLRDYIDSIVSPDMKGFWRAADAYAVSLLKSYWGDAATAENDFAFDYLPRLTGDHGTYQTVMDMLDDKVEGYLVFGQNPAVGSAHGRMQRLGHGAPEVAGRARPRPHRDRDLLEGRARRSRPGSCGPRTSAPRCSSSPPPRTWRRTARSPRPSGCCSGTTRRSSRPATPAASCTSSSTSAARSASGWPAPPLERDRPLLDLVWDYPVDEHRRARPPRRC